jgi:hypothetical protein
MTDLRYNLLNSLKTTYSHYGCSFFEISNWLQIICCSLVTSGARREYIYRSKCTVQRRDAMLALTTWRQLKHCLKYVTRSIAGNVPTRLMGTVCALYNKWDTLYNLNYNYIWESNVSSKERWNLSAYSNGSQTQHDEWLFSTGPLRFYIYRMNLISISLEIFMCVGGVWKS